MLSTCLKGRTRALPSIFPASFPYAIIEPVNVIAPINTPRNTSTSCIAISAPTNPCVPKISEFRPIKTAANPTNECNAATSWGISVISTL